MNSNQSFGLALKKVRKARGLTQEDFSSVSSRTYISSLERGVKGPTLDKVEILAKEIGVHPLTVLVLTYIDHYNDQNFNNLVDKVKTELQNLFIE